MDSKMKKLLFKLPMLFSLTLLSACSSTGASHLPSIFQLPGAIIGSAIENTAYHARRNRVESFVAKHYLAIREDVNKGGGPALEGALDAAGLAGDKRSKARQALISRPIEHFHNVNSVVDNLIYPFSALYEVKQADKKTNGFTHLEAREVIRRFANTHFEALRMAIKQGDGLALDQLAARLRINDASKLMHFKQRAQTRYKTIYLEPVTLALMVYQ